MWQHTEGMVGFVENLLGFPAVKVFSATFVGRYVLTFAGHCTSHLKSKLTSICLNA